MHVVLHLRDNTTFFSIPFHIEDQQFLKKISSLETFKRAIPRNGIKKYPVFFFHSRKQRRELSEGVRKFILNVIERKIN